MREIDKRWREDWIESGERVSGWEIVGEREI